VTSAYTIQPIGFHLRLSDDWQVTAVSANIGQFLDKQAQDLLGNALTSVFSDDIIHDIRNRMALLRGDGASEHLFHVTLAPGGDPFDLSICRDGDGYALDGEPCAEHRFGDSTSIIMGLLARIEGAGTVLELGEAAARQMRALTGFEQVFVCGGGQILGQSCRGEAPALDPATFAQADLLVIDREASPVALLIHENSGLAIKSVLASPTTLETAALSSLGTRAAMILPLNREGVVWGHLACFHSSPRHVGAERRAVARLFTHLLSLKIELAEQRGA
jgi:light-regulated signal transduction histidine kinase (bacteriophytochrome)